MPITDYINDLRPSCIPIFRRWQTPAYSLSNNTLPSTCRMVTIPRNKLENNTIKDYFSVASVICVNYKPPLNYELQNSCHSVRPLWTWKTLTSTNSMCTGNYVSYTNVEGGDNGDDSSPVLCPITEFQNTQTYFTLHLMVTPPDSGKSHASTTCRKLKQKLLLPVRIGYLDRDFRPVLKDGTFREI